MMLIKGIAVIAGILFVLSPLRSGTQVLVFIGSIVVLLACHFALTELDETYAAKGPTGYWPKRLDWNPPQHSGDTVRNDNVGQMKRGQ